MAALCAWMGNHILYVQAEPATLTSPDAAVYEQADESSSQVGNLVEGSVFEYLGDVTAQDGSVWHQILTAGGTTGYIRGDTEMETGQEEPVSEGQDGGQTAAGDTGEAAPEENEPGEGGEGTGEPAAENLEEGGGENENTGAAPDGETADETEGGEDEAGESEDGINMGYEPVNNSPMQNNQLKKYALDDSAKIKERESPGETSSGTEQSERKKAGPDVTLIFAIAVIFFCSGVTAFCLNRMKMLKEKADTDKTPDSEKTRNIKKTEKKRNSHKRKTKKTGKWMWKKQSVRNKQR